MKKNLLAALALSLLVPTTLMAKKKPEAKTCYLMVYHKDADHGLHMAVSRDGYTFTSLNNDEPCIAGDSIAEQHGIRDPHIFRGPDGGFYLAMTDLHLFSQKKYADRPKYKKISEYRDTEWEREGSKYGWGNNRGLVLMKSFDLIHWTRTNLDFSKLTCPTGVTNMHGVPTPWSEVGCVWAPETVYDEEAGKILVHFTTRFKTGMNLIYYVYMNTDFTEMISEPKLLFEAPLNEHGFARYNIIDSDIVKAGDTYHLFYVSHEKGATVKHATSANITGPYVMDDNYDDGEPQGHEAPNCWKRLDNDKWVVMFDNYSRNPHNFGFVETSDFKTFNPIGYFDAEGSPMKRTNFSEQKHAAVAPMTESEVKTLEKYWNKNSKKK